MVPFILLSKPVLKDGKGKMLAAAAIIYLLYSSLTGGLSTVILFDQQQWNWAGKVIILVGCIIFFIRNKTISAREAGLTLKQRNGAILPCLVLIAGGLLVRLGIYFLAQNPSLHFDMETIAFQGTVNAFSDELVFRGLILTLFNRLYSGSEEIAGFPLNWPILLSSLLFGLSQGLIFQAGYHLEINLARILFAFVAGLVAGMLKERSGSLIFPAIFHALWNLIGNH